MHSVAAQCTTDALRCVLHTHRYIVDPMFSTIEGELADLAKTFASAMVDT